MNTGTEGGGSLTSVGDDCLFMAGCHVAHDVHIANRVILVNNVALGGTAFLRTTLLLEAFLAYINLCVSVAEQLSVPLQWSPSVIPYGLVQAPRGELDGLNLVGLKRRGVARSDIMALRAAFQMLAQGGGRFRNVPAVLVKKAKVNMYSALLNL